MHEKIIAYLQAGIDDPMWADHFEVHKRAAMKIIEFLSAQAQAVAQVPLTPLDESIIQSACPFDDGRDAETWLSAVEWYEAYRGIGAPK